MEQSFSELLQELTTLTSQKTEAEFLVKTYTERIEAISTKLIQTEIKLHEYEKRFTLHSPSSITINVPTYSSEWSNETKISYVLRANKVCMTNRQIVERIAQLENMDGDEIFVESLVKKFSDLLSNRVKSGKVFNKYTTNNIAYYGLTNWFAPGLNLVYPEYMSNK